MRAQILCSLTNDFIALSEASRTKVDIGEGIQNMLGIIGVSGFVATVLYQQLLAQNKKSVCFDVNEPIANVGYLHCDVTTPLVYDELRGCDVLINLAAEHRDDVKPVSRYYDVNVEGARNVCRAASDYGVKTIVLTSSVAIYGFAPVCHVLGC